MATDIRVGIIGTSWWTELMYLPSLASHPDARVAAICGRGRERAEALAAAWDIPSVHTDWHELVAQEGLDAVMVVTPDDRHQEMTLAALEHGRHVLCEKPIANTAAAAKEMYAAAEARGVKHMVDFNWRFLPQFRYFRQLVDAGYIGRARQMTAHFIGGYAFDRTYAWRFDGNRANGVVGDLGSHLIDLFRLFVGDVASVSADLQQVVDRSGIDGPPAGPSNDCAFVTLRSTDGAQGLIHVSACSPSGDRVMRMGLTLHGDAGTLEAERIFDGVEMRVDLRGIRPGMGHFERLTVPEALLDGLPVEDLLGPFSRQSAGPRFFIDAIRDDLPIPMSFRDGWRTQQVVDAALLSDRERRWVEVGEGALSPA